MIKSWFHKGLQKFFETGSKAGIQAAHAEKLSERLFLLNRIKDVQEMNLPSYRLHQLKGDRSDIWSVRVSGNWRLTFQFIDGDAYVINYEDYH
ncbi:MAG: type II toxin-antitoxin system RelE/ParE family toxin [Burkholderiales bacterium]|uniref:type II toxin-antitoxin system RelE/ParE family toxin n=1 Tax=uncultured Turicimonas sp. TaxID=1918607 RepID=UPI001ED3AAE5|nr:type II toxin-antitoxin system RelE/ParE family toxin [uncultured Turicimonas sp.]MBS4846759.1 type II toxin-antitoxin system RelE/ParE family toxin [Burkholderiales bacterium]